MDDRDQEPRHQHHDLVPDAKREASGMFKQGMDHPSTKPVLVGAAVGAVAGVILPVLTLPVGALIGAGFAFYKRLRP